MNVYLYTRKSRALGDPDDPHLLSHHLAALKLLADRDRVIVPEANIRTEIGSGESIDQRPVFRALLAEWEAIPPHGGGFVYVIEPARLSRGSNAERGRILDALIRANLIVVCPDRRYDPSNPNDELLWNVVQSVDRSEVQRYKQRVALRRAEMTRNGEPTTGNPPWGYVWIKSPGQVEGRRVPGHFAPHPERFPILLAVCREVLTTSVLALSARYGVPYGILQDTLHNPTICGFPARRYGPHHGARPWREPLHLLPREQWLWPEKPGDYPAACTLAEWEAIQLVLAERHSRKLKTGAALDDGWCRAVVRFVGHAAPVKLWSVKLGRGQVPAYACPRPGASPLYVEREPVHAAVLPVLQQLCCRRVIDNLAGLVAIQQQQPPDPTPLRQQLARERERFARLKEDLAAPDLDAEERLALSTAERQCRRRLDKLKQDLADLAALPSFLPDATMLLPALSELAEEFEGMWNEMTGAEREAITRALVKEVPVTVIPGKWGVRWERTIGEPVLADWLIRI